jgi:hypothetical protein
MASTKSAVRPAKKNDVMQRHLGLLPVHRQHGHHGGFTRNQMGTVVRDGGKERRDQRT